MWALTAASIATALACGLYFVLATIITRLPYWGEAEPLFEASRIRAGQPLFVDPLLGASGLGEPPSRWFVTYPPVWSFVLSLAPKGAALVLGRVACTLAWLGALGGLAATSRRENRVNAIACAAFVAGMWIILNFATTARPDSIACALAAFALARAMKKGKIDFVSGALFVLVPWVKPTLLGLPVGAFVGDALARRAKIPIPVAIAATIVISFASNAASGGVLFEHVSASNAQPISLATWLEHVPARLPFFLPLFALAAWNGWRDRHAPGTAIGLSALVASFVWVLASLAKTGSASNYWMEPCIAAVALIAYAQEGPFRFAVSGGALHAGIALATAIYADVAAVRSSLEHAKDYRDDAAFVAHAKERCTGVTLADEAGVELAMNGRIIVPTYQMVYLVRAGRFPAAPWTTAIESPQVTCFVEHSGQYRLSPDLSRALDARFVLAEESGAWRRWVPR
jgi:hypothetical protein